MKIPTCKCCLISFGLLIWLAAAATSSFAQTTAFTYQGKLTDAGNPANGNYDLQFKLVDTVTVGTGAQQGATLVRNPVVVSAGIFTVTLDFGANVFGGADRFLEIGVRPAGSGGAYTVLAPRQPITSTPYAIQTLNAQQLGGLPASSFVQNTTTAQAGANFNVGGTGTVGNLNVNGAVSLAGSAAPATAPVGQGRLYFDATANKLKVSESGGAFVNLVGATGVSGSGTVNTIPLWSAGTTLANSLITQTGASIQLPNNVQLGVGAQGNQVQFGSPNSETGMSISGASGRADLRFDGTLKLVNGPGGVPPATNGLAITTAGNVGIGTTTPANKLDVNGGLRAFFNGSTQVVAETTGSTNSWARLYMATPSRRWFWGSSQNFNGNQVHLFDETSEQFRMTVQPNGGDIAFPLGNVGIGTTTPNTRLTLNGGTPWTSAGWTASLNLQNVSAFGWEANASGQRFGIGQSNGGLYFFRTNSPFGNNVNPANYDMQITDTGNLAQSEQRNGLPKAMLYVDPFLPAAQYIVRCYNGVSGASGTGNGSCGGFNVVRTSAGIYTITFPFQVNQRFLSATQEFNFIVRAFFTSANTVSVQMFNGGNFDSPFFLIIY